MSCLPFADQSLFWEVGIESAPQPLLPQQCRGAELDNFFNFTGNNNIVRQLLAG